MLIPQKIQNFFREDFFREDFSRENFFRENFFSRKFLLNEISFDQCENSKQGRTRLIYAIFSEEFIFLMFPMKIFFISVTTTSRIVKIRYRLSTSCRKFFGWHLDHVIYIIKAGVCVWALWCSANYSYSFEAMGYPYSVLLSFLPDFCHSFHIEAMGYPSTVWTLLHNQKNQMNCCKFSSQLH